MLGINILTIKANEMQRFSNLFHKILYMFRTGSLSVIRSMSTLYTSNRYLSWYFFWSLLAWSEWKPIMTTLADGKTVRMEPHHDHASRRQNGQDGTPS